MKPDAPRVARDDMHENTYLGVSPSSFVHRSRIRTLTAALRSLPISERGTLADFGCSNGFILQLLRGSKVLGDAWTLHGYDHSGNFIERARAKQIPGTEFDEFSLSTVSDRFAGKFDVVMCLETLEHCGDFRNALRNLEIACKPGGMVVITVPIEIGLPGAIKYFGRRVFRRGAYSKFFSNKSEIDYIRALLSGSNLEDFRQPAQKGWPEHLGFDNRRLEQFLTDEFLAPAKLTVVQRRRIGLGFGRLYVLQKRPVDP